jgi:phenylpyruvate tautomerase PptA (4-oxalocrotonate tautomerase family)
MPLITVRATPGAFDADSKDRLVQAITDAGCVAESVPDEHRIRCVVLWEDLAEAFLGGKAAGPLARILVITFVASDGVLDPVRRQGFSAAVQAAAESEPADGRPVMSSIVFYDVPEGRWGRDGKMPRLAELAAAAGFEHLRGLNR